MTSDKNAASIENLMAGTDIEKDSVCGPIAMLEGTIAALKGITADDRLVWTHAEGARWTCGKFF